MILYHGTKEVFPKPRSFSFFTDEYGVALYYARNKLSSWSPEVPGRVLQCHVDTGKLVEVAARDVCRALTCEEDYQDGDDLPGMWSWDESDSFLRRFMRLVQADTLLVRGLKDMAPEDHSGVYNQFIVADPNQVTITNEACIKYIDGSLVKTEYVYPEDNYEQCQSRQRVQLPALAA